MTQIEIGGKHNEISVANLVWVEAEGEVWLLDAFLDVLYVLNNPQKVNPPSNNAFLFLFFCYRSDLEW